MAGRKLTTRYNERHRRTARPARVLRRGRTPPAPVGSLRRVVGGGCGEAGGGGTGAVGAGFDWNFRRFHLLDLGFEGAPAAIGS